MSSTPNFPNVPNTGAVTVNNAAGTTPQAAFTAGAGGSIIRSLTAVNPDNEDHEMQLYLNDILVTECIVPANSGVVLSSVYTEVFDFTSLKAFQTRINSEGVLWWQIEASLVIKFASKAGLTSGKTCILHVDGIDL